MQCLSGPSPPSGAFLLEMMRLDFRINAMSASESFDHADATNLIAPRAAAETLLTHESDSSRRVLKASEKRVWLPPYREASEMALFVWRLGTGVVGR
jgi:hypothetical protein